MTTDSGRQDLYLGIDVGGTKAVVVVAHDEGDILAESRLEHWTRGGWREDLRTLSAECERLVASAGIDKRRIAALGVSSPGPLSVREGRVIETPNLEGWRDVPIVAHLSEALGVPVRLDNDANAAALAEWRFGAGQGTRHLIYLTMSTGLGAGLILDGHLYRGASDQAGEVGHMPVVPGGRRCNCGQRGCLEAYTGGAALADIIREEIAAGERSDILDRADGKPERISARLWTEAVRAGDEYALRLRERFLDHLAAGISLLIPVFDPDIIVFGTIIQRNPDLFLDDLTARVRGLTLESLHHVRLAPGELGERMPAYAALSVALSAERDR